MSSIELFHQAHDTRDDRNAAASLFRMLASASDRIIRNALRRRRQRLDRAAFMNLVGKEDWIYRDLGIHRGDVEWAARLPIHVNAAYELEKLRARSMMGR